MLIFFTLFDDYINLCNDNIVKAVKKNAYKNKAEVSFICLKNEKQNVIEIFEEMYFLFLIRFIFIIYFVLGLRKF